MTTSYTPTSHHTKHTKTTRRKADAVHTYTVQTVAYAIARKEREFEKRLRTGHS